MPSHNYAALDRELCDLLGLSVAPIAISFLPSAPAGVAAFGGAKPAPAADGRTGAVPAGCVFWMHAVTREFATDAADHGNCSVGSVTHGFKSLQDVSGNADVAPLLESKWVAPESVSAIPTVAERPGSVVYAPLAQASVEPQVVFIRLNGKQMMFVHEAWPGLRLEGKPQCHIIPIAKEAGEVAVSSGCMLSRVRTGMSNNEVTCAIPAGLLADFVAQLRAARAADMAVAVYASEDAKRFG
jgi:uncharacterized protein (DUF169 family)